MNRGAVFHANHTESGILDLVGLRIPGAESVAFCGLGKVPQFVKYGTIHADRLVIAHHPQRHVQRMRADINERPAALQRFVGEYPPGGNRAAAHGMRLGIRYPPAHRFHMLCEVLGLRDGNGFDSR